MEIQQLKEELIQGKLRPFYIFTGDELALQDIYINKIQQLSGLSLKRIDSLLAVRSNLVARTLVKTTPMLYVVRNDEVYLTAEKSWDTFLKANSLKGNIIILLYSGLDKNNKMLKHHESICTQFDFILGNGLRNRLMATTGMPAAYCEDIVKLCCYNYGRIKNELYKLYAFGKLQNCNINTAYLKAKKIDLIHEDIGDIIFDFTNAIIERNIPKAYELWPKVQQTEDGPLRIISVLYNSFRQILMVQSTQQKDRTEQVLGMTQAQIYVTDKKCNVYNLFELVDIVKTLRYLEKGIKLGLVEEKYSIDYLMGVIW